MSLPKSLKVGGAVYEVKLWDPVPTSDIHICGRALHDSRVIEIANNLIGTRMAETLLHEVLHCVETQWHLSDDASPEQRVEVYERGLHAVIVDNPKLFDWIVQELRAVHGERDAG